MPLFNTRLADEETPTPARQTIAVGRISDIPVGRCATFALADGRELGLYNVAGEFYATDNSCPHRGAPLAEGKLCGHLIECALHGWQFDVRDGKCLLASERIETYLVTVEEGLIKVEV
jgi:nitrite reductase/ring-hydroxylating ferredoxin subunit